MVEGPVAGAQIQSICSVGGGRCATHPNSAARTVWGEVVGSNGREGGRVIPDDPAMIGIDIAVGSEGCVDHSVYQRKA